MHFTVNRALLFALMAIYLVSCMDQDPFGLSTRDIQGAYELEQWDNLLFERSIAYNEPWVGSYRRNGWSIRLGRGHHTCLAD